MSELFKSNHLLGKKSARTSTKAHSTYYPPKASLNVTYSGGGTDAVEKETCSQSTRNLLTVNLTAEEQVHKCTQLSKKRKKDKDVNKYYLKQKKKEIECLETEKAFLSNELALISTKNMVALFNFLPLSLVEFKEIITPPALSLGTFEGCVEYGDYLSSQISTLKEIYQFDSESNHLLYRQQYLLYEYLLKIYSFVCKLKSYHEFLQKIQ